VVTKYHSVTSEGTGAEIVTETSFGSCNTKHWWSVRDKRQS